MWKVPWLIFFSGFFFFGGRSLNDYRTAVPLVKLVYSFSSSYSGVKGGPLHT